MSPSIKISSQERFEQKKSDPKMQTPVHIVPETGTLTEIGDTPPFESTLRCNRHDTPALSTTMFHFMENESAVSP